MVFLCGGLERVRSCVRQENFYANKGLFGADTLNSASTKVVGVVLVRGGACGIKD